MLQSLLEVAPHATLISCQDQTCLWMGNQRQLVDGQRILEQTMEKYNTTDLYAKANLQTHIQYIEGKRERYLHLHGNSIYIYI